MGKHKTTYNIFQGQIEHAKLRAKQHYHLDFSRAVRRRFKKIIKENLASLVKKDRGKDVYDVPYQKEIYRVVYNPRNSNIVTFLPRDN